MSLIEKNLIITLQEIINNPHRRAYLHAVRLCNKHNLNFYNISTNIHLDCLNITYKSPETESVCNIEVDEDHYGMMVYIKVGYTRKTFRLKTKVLSPAMPIINVIIKDLKNDIGFQKKLFDKILDYLQWRIKDDIESAIEKKKATSEKADIVLQFPDWDVESRHGCGWRLQHKTKNIIISMTKELDIETIIIPTNLFTAYPDEAFMENLLNLFEEKVNLADNSIF